MSGHGIYVLGVSIFPLSTILNLILEYSGSVVFFVFHFLVICVVVCVTSGLNIRENVLRIESKEESLYFDQNKTLQSSPSTHLIKLDVDDDLCFYSKINHSICK